MTIAAQVGRLRLAVEGLARTVASLSGPRFVDKLDGWSARDIVAHLIGWNRHVVEGSRQIARGELPFYDLDPGENYSKVNAELVRRYPSRDLGELLAELRASGRELEEFLASLDADDWGRDHGVRHRGAVVTIRTTVEELIEDYAHHQEQIERWASGKERR